MRKYADRAAIGSVLRTARRTGQTGRRFGGTIMRLQYSARAQSPVEVDEEDGMSERKAPEGWNALPNWMSMSQDWVHQVADLNPFSKLFPFNYAEMGQALITLGTEMIKDPAG